MYTWWFAISRNIQSSMSICDEWTRSKVNDPPAFHPLNFTERFLVISISKGVKNQSAFPSSIPYHFKILNYQLKFPPLYRLEFDLPIRKTAAWASSIRHFSASLPLRMNERTLKNAGMHARFPPNIIRVLGCTTYYSATDHKNWLIYGVVLTHFEGKNKIRWNIQTKLKQIPQRIENHFSPQSANPELKKWKKQDFLADLPDWSFSLE